jgi:hypothetical protein
MPPLGICSCTAATSVASGILCGEQSAQRVLAFSFLVELAKSQPQSFFSIVVPLGESMVVVTSRRPGADQPPLATAAGLALYLGCIGLALLARKATAFLQSCPSSARQQQSKPPLAAARAGAGASNAIEGNVAGVLELVPPFTDTQPFRRTMINDALVRPVVELAQYSVCTNTIIRLRPP